MLPKPKNIEIENKEGSYILVCRNVSLIRSLIVLILMGLYWLLNVWLWKQFTFNTLGLFFGLSVVFTVYVNLINALGKSTIEVGEDKILAHKIQFPFPTRKIIETKEIEEILCEYSNWLNSYSVKAKLKSGKKIKLFETTDRNNAQFLLTALDFSVKQFQLNEGNKKVLSLNK